MTRLTRMLLPVSLCALVTGAIILACGGRPSGPGDVPVAPRPEPVDPSGQPLPATHPADPSATLSDSGTPGTPKPGSPLSAVLSGSRTGGVSPELVLAAQAAPPPGGSPTRPGAPSPGAPSPAQPGAPQPGAPSQPAPPPGSPPPGSPPPGSPPAAPPPSQPAPSQPGPAQPGSPAQPAPPADAGISDAVSLPPVPDGNIPSDSRMEPILRRD